MKDNTRNSILNFLLRLFLKLTSAPQNQKEARFTRFKMTKKNIRAKNNVNIWML